MTLRLRFWLAMMDVTNAVFGFGSPAYLWACSKAGDATDWGDELASQGDGEEPF